MLKIIACDDDKEDLNLLTSYIKDGLKESGLEGAIVLDTDNPVDVSDYLKLNSVDIFFLDIIYKNYEKSGIELGKVINKAHINPYIVFISDKIDYTLQVFKARPFDFLPKPIDYNSIKNCIIEIDMDMKKRELNINELSKTILIRSGANQYILRIKDIIYIEMIRGRAIIHMPDKDISCYESLEFFENRLCEDCSFIRCHKSFIVNKNYIAEIRKGKKEIIFTNGRSCNIGRKYKEMLFP